MSNCRKDRGRFYDRLHFLWPCKLPSGFLALCEQRAQVKGQGSAKLLEGVSLPCQPAGYNYRFQLQRTLSLFLSVPAESILLPDRYFFLQPCFPGVCSTSLHLPLLTPISLSSHHTNACVHSTQAFVWWQTECGVKDWGLGVSTNNKKGCLSKVNQLFFRSLSGTACSTNPVENGTGGGGRSHTRGNWREAILVKKRIRIIFQFSLKCY